MALVLRGVEGGARTEPLQKDLLQHVLRVGGVLGVLQGHPVNCVAVPAGGFLQSRWVHGTPSFQVRWKGPFT